MTTLVSGLAETSVTEPPEEAAERLATKWGLGPTRTLTGGSCGIVLTDGERVVKVPFVRWHGLRELRALQAFRKNPAFISPLSSDDASGGLLLPFIEGIHPEVTLSVDKIAEVALSIESTEPSGVVVPWPRLDQPIHADLRDIYRWSLAFLPKPDSTDKVLWCHGDLWHQNIIERPDGSLVFIDPVARWGTVLSEAAELANRTIAYQNRKVSEVLGLIADAFHLDPSRLRVATGIYSIVNASGHRHLGNFHKSELHLEVARELLPANAPDHLTSTTS